MGSESMGSIGDSARVEKKETPTMSIGEEIKGIVLDEGKDFLEDVQGDTVAFLEELGTSVADITAHAAAGDAAAIQDIKHLGAQTALMAARHGMDAENRSVKVMSKIAAVAIRAAVAGAVA